VVTPFKEMGWNATGEILRRLL